MRRPFAVAFAVVALALAPVTPLAQAKVPPAEPVPAPKAEAGTPAAEPAPKAPAPSSEGERGLPGSAAKPPAAATDLARALLTADQWGKVLEGYASSLAGQISQALLAAGEKVPDDLKGKLRGELEKTLPYQQTLQAQAEALAGKLTPDELRKAAAFYGSPLGRKVLDQLPQAQSAVAQQLQARLATAVPEIVTRLAPKAMQGSPHGGGPGAAGTGSGSGGATPPAGRRPPP